MTKKPSDAARALALILALTAGGALTACASGGADDADAGGGEQSDAQQQGADGSGDDVTDDDAEADAEAGDEVPTWVTDNFPIYPDSEVSTTSGTNPLIIGFTVTTDDGQAVIDWYNEQYNQGGWATDLVQNDGARFNAEHSDGYMAVVGVNSMSTVTIVTLTAHNAG